MLLLYLSWFLLLFRVAADVDTKTVTIKSAPDDLVAQACCRTAL